MVSNLAKGWLRIVGVGFFALTIIAAIAIIPSSVQAQQSDNREFNIQVSPATLPVVLKPGVQKTVSVTVRNFSNHPETLAPALSGFRMDRLSRHIKLDDKPPANMSAWVTFKQNELTLQPGESKSLEVAYNTPANAGFSYAAAITLSRTNNSTDKQVTSLRGTVAIFTLVTIDRPDAKRELSIETFTSKQGTYEFLPATFSMTIKNDGNVIDQPAGNIFIQRSFNDDAPIATIPINAASAYILPGNSRMIATEWKNGFPLFANVAAPGQTPALKLTWDWKNTSQLRFGRYIAKAVLVYNDGKRDVPVITSVTFWVIPWRIIIVSLILMTVLIMGLFGWGRLIAQGTKKVRRYAVRK